MLSQATHAKYRRRIKRAATERDYQLDRYHALQPAGEAALCTPPSARTTLDDGAIAAYLQKRESLADAQEALNEAYDAYNKALVRSARRDAKH